MTNNIAAIMRTDVKAVNVLFAKESERTYTYLTTFDVQEGDMVVVPVKGSGKNAGLKVAIVDDVKLAEIDPNDEITYSYVVHHFNLDAYQKVLAENEEIERLIANAQRISMRNAFANSILANVDETTRTRLETLTNQHPKLDI